MSRPDDAISRAQVLALGLGALALGVGVTVGVSLSMGASPRTAAIAAGALAGASVAGLAPGLLRVKAETWGLLVFGSSIARLMLVVLIGFILDNAIELDRRPFWLSLATGAVVILIAETVVAVRAISRFDKLRRTAPASAGVRAVERTEA